MSIELVIQSNHLILCYPLLLLTSIFPSITVFSSELALRIRWPKYWSFSISSVQSLSLIWLFATPWTVARQASLSITNSQSLLKLMSFCWWCHATISSSVIAFSACLPSFPASGSFPMSQFFSWDGQSIGASTSASVLPMNIQGWFPLGLTSLICLQSKGLSRVFSNTTVQRHQFFALSFCYGPTLTSIPDYWKNHSFD